MIHAIAQFFGLLRRVLGGLTLRCEAYARMWIVVARSVGAKAVRVQGVPMLGADLLWPSWLGAEVVWASTVGAGPLWEW
ncbi:hypothetical protein MLGJGCBP_06757 [Rhodococcus sp. T7]|nr:hypothetical protein MLGJGCBP_09851 [Rhodococcus sp. T7]KAF0960178.1 hypothetical protein MLGJGCBP_06757 [Rhodococcus sp. T7]